MDKFLYLLSLIKSVLVKKRTENFKTFSVLLLSVGNVFFLISKTVLKNTHHMRIRFFVKYRYFYNIQ